MVNRIRRLYEMYLRVVTFMTANADDFADVPFVAPTVDSLRTLTATLGTLGANKVTTTAQAKDAVLSKSDAKDSLRDYLEYIAEVWRAAYDEAGDGAEQNKFRIPAGNNAQNLIAAGRAFAAALVDDKEVFIAHGLPPDVIEQVRNRTDAFEQALGAAGAARGERVGTNAAFDEPAQQAKRLVDKLAPTVKRKYRADPQKLAEWLVASHLQPAAKTVTKTPEANKPV